MSNTHPSLNISVDKFPGVWYTDFNQPKKEKQEDFQR